MAKATGLIMCLLNGCGDHQCAEDLNSQYNQILQIRISASEELPSVYKKMAELGKKAHAHAVAKKLSIEYDEYKQIKVLIRRSRYYARTERQPKKAAGSTICSGVQYTHD